ncbi:MAG: DUF4159 domain-containing protein [Pikeienuella sp.]
MFQIGSLAFLNPWLLAVLLALPLLWLLLRATPPSPARITFPGVRLLLGLDDPEKTPQRTPWWLLLLRTLIVLAIVLAFAKPVLNPKTGVAGNGPLVLVMDGGWASAPDWEARRAAALTALDQAERTERAVSLHVLATPVAPDFKLDLRPAAEWRGAIEALEPAPWAPLRADYTAAFDTIEAPAGTGVFWVADGLLHDGGELADALGNLGALKIAMPLRPATALSAARIDEGVMTISAMRADEYGQADETARIAVFGRAPNGGERRLATLEAPFIEGAQTSAIEIDLPLELRNQITRFALVGNDSAGAVVLTDESLRLKRVGLSTGGSEESALRLLSNLHYLRSALSVSADLVEGDVASILAANPDAIFLADIGRLSKSEQSALSEFVESGGLLVRFAGPRMAKGADLASGRRAGTDGDELLPVPLRSGGRTVGGAMAWATPQAIKPFDRESPFFGIETPHDVSVSRQILARLGPDVANATWAALADGTPLVTASPRGAGRIVLFHVTANAEWSNLPLSGLFVEMLGRLIAGSGVGGGGIAPEDDAQLQAMATIDGFGRVSPAAPDLGVITGARLKAAPGADAPPGLYGGETSRVSYNLFPDENMGPALAAPAPLSAVVETLGEVRERSLASFLLIIAFGLLCLDLLLALWLSGRRFGLTQMIGAMALVVVSAPQADAQSTDIDRLMQAANNTVLAYVVTGDSQVDRIAQAGMRGLSNVLFARTAIEPAEPMAVDLERDDLSLFPLLYWPITEQQPSLSDQAIARVNTYMRSGGMIIFDTRDAHLATPGRPGPNTAELRRLATGLDLPPLTPVPEGHVLTRTFFLLDRFPGRWTGGQLWLEATAPPDEEVADSLIADPNDGVSPVLIGSADWAAAWAINENGELMVPVGRVNGYRQREMAFRFGVNAAMYALTGNYKSDQVHVPALLDRLGQ